MKTITFLLLPLFVIGQYQSTSFFGAIASTKCKHRLSFITSVNFKSFSCSAGYFQINYDLDHKHTKGSGFLSSSYSTITPLEHSRHLFLTIGQSISKNKFEFLYAIGPEYVFGIKRGDYLRTDQIVVSGGFLSPKQYEQLDVYESLNTQGVGLYTHAAIYIKLFKWLRAGTIYNYTLSRHFSDHSLMFAIGVDI